VPVADRRQGVVLSFRYWSLRRLFELVVLRCRAEQEKEIEILLLATSCGCWSVRLLVRS
jgi:hypothetical protein